MPLSRLLQSWWEWIDPMWFLIQLLIIATVVIHFLPCALTLTGSKSFHEQLPSGYVDMEEHFDKYGFQDYTDYCKYYYDRANVIESDERFREVSQSEIEEIKGFFRDTQEAMRLENRISEFDFDEGCISEGDYVYIIEDTEASKQKYYSYGVLFFDKESYVLYYIHCNK